MSTETAPGGDDRLCDDRQVTSHTSATAAYRNAEGGLSGVAGGRQNASASPTLPGLLLGADVTFLVAGGGLAAWVGGIRASALVVLVTLFVLLARFRYRWRFTLSVLDDLPMLAGAVGVATLLSAVVFTVVLTDRSNFPDVWIGDGLLAGVVILVFVVAGRMIAFSVVRGLRRRRIGLARAVIVGCDQTAQRLGHAFERDVELGVELVGYVDFSTARTGDRHPLGSLEDLPGIVEDHRVDLVLIAHVSCPSQTVVDAVRSLSMTRCELFVVPRLHELHDGAVTGDLVRGLPLVRLRRLAFRSPSWRLKRALDVVAAAVALVVVAPVMLGVAIAVRLETGPGVIFRQQRIGREGHIFTLYKFRSLKPAAGEDSTRWSIDGDPRLGPVGTFIRSTSLDELPQLVNVLRGHMSLVGPRPERPYFVEEFSASVPGYHHRHRMPVGLTGLAVVHGLRGDTDISGRAELDNLYAESWSLWLDIKIILRTAAQLVPSARTSRRRGPTDYETVPASGVGRPGPGGQHVRSGGNLSGRAERNAP